MSDTIVHLLRFRADLVVKHFDVTNKNHTFTMLNNSRFVSAVISRLVY